MGDIIDFISLSEFDKGWVVGLIEGEGSVSLYRNCPRVSIGMTDRDTIERYRTVLGLKTKIIVESRKNNLKTMYRVRVNGMQAMLFMEDLFPYMSQRRQQRIQEILLKYGR